MGLSGIAPWIDRKNSGRSGGESTGDAQRYGAADALVRPLTNLLYLEVDPNWLDQHPNIADDYRARLTFTFFDNESGFTETAQPNYGNIDVVGRPEAYKTYSNTTNKEIQITFQFHAQGLPDGFSFANGFGGFSPETSDIPVSVAESILAEVTRPARFLDSLKYPIEDPNNGLSYAPPPILLKVGSLFIGRCILQDAQLIWQEPFDPNTLLAEAAEVACTFAVVRTVPRNYLSAGGPIEGVWQ